MLGSKWEWVEDCYHSDYIGAPSAGEVWNSDECGFRVLRGGGGGDSPDMLRVSARVEVEPTGTYDHFGFRCVK